MTELRHTKISVLLIHKRYVLYLMLKLMNPTLLFEAPVKPYSR